MALGVRVGVEDGAEKAFGLLASALAGERAGQRIGSLDGIGLQLQVVAERLFGRREAVQLHLCPAEQEPELVVLWRFGRQFPEGRGGPLILPGTVELKGLGLRGRMG